MDQSKIFCPDFFFCLPIIIDGSKEVIIHSINIILVLLQTLIRGSFTISSIEGELIHLLYIPTSSPIPIDTSPDNWVGYSA